MKENFENRQRNGNFGTERNEKPYEKKDGNSSFKRPSFNSGSSNDRKNDRPFNKFPKRDDNQQSSGEKRFGNRSNFDKDNSGNFNRENRGNYGNDNRNSFNKDNRSGGFGNDNRGSYNKDNRSSGFGNDNRGSYNKDNRSGGFSSDNRSGYNKDNRNSFDKDNRGGFNRDNRNSFNKDNRSSYNQDNRNSGGLSFRKKSFNSDEPRGEKLSFRKANEVRDSKFIETRFDGDERKINFRPRKNSDGYDPNAKYSRKKQFEHQKNNFDPTKPVRLNKFLANAGICSRREADEYIKAGVITVNGEYIVELGAKILPTDKVMFHDQPVRSERKVYILLNKPKDCVTTSEDTHARLTVLDLVKNACSERIYPVGRLDRNTTGVLLLTNDGDLASRLTHPKYEKKKIYHVVLDKDIDRNDFEQILAGVELEDVKIAADALDFVKEDSLNEVGIEIHTGQNRVVRRIFEKLGYKILRLDRVFFAGLTKKSLPRGKYRFLNEREVNMLKMGAYE